MSALRCQLWLLTLMPQPLSWTWMSFRPPSLTTTWILVDFASKLRKPRRRFGEQPAACSALPSAPTLRVTPRQIPASREPPHARWLQPPPSAVRAGKGLYQFSIISLMAFAGLWITSPAAMRFTTASSSRRITPAILRAVTGGRRQGGRRLPGALRGAEGTRKRGYGREPVGWQEPEWRPGGGYKELAKRATEATGGDRRIPDAAGRGGEGRGEKGREGADGPAPAKRTLQQAAARLGKASVRHTVPAIPEAEINTDGGERKAVGLRKSTAIG